MEKVFKALASEPRRRMLNHLAGGPMCPTLLMRKHRLPDGPKTGWMLF